MKLRGASFGCFYWQWRPHDVHMRSLLKWKWFCHLHNVAIFILFFNQFLIRLKVDDGWLKQREQMCRRKAHQMHFYTFAFLKVSVSLQKARSSSRTSATHVQKFSRFSREKSWKIAANNEAAWTRSGFSLARNIFGASLTQFESYDRFTHRRNSTWLSNTSQAISWAQQRRKRCTTSKDKYVKRRWKKLYKTPTLDLGASSSSLAQLKATKQPVNNHEKRQ